jgi:hypothetical protein
MAAGTASRMASRSDAERGEPSPGEWVSLISFGETAGKARDRTEAGSGTRSHPKCAISSYLMLRRLTKGDTDSSPWPLAKRLQVE